MSGKKVHLNGNDRSLFFLGGEAFSGQASDLRRTRGPGKIHIEYWT